jgi:hypothetical protein
VSCHLFGVNSANGGFHVQDLILWHCRENAVLYTRQSRLKEAHKWSLMI